MATAPKIDCIRPHWQAPASVRACVTTRAGGYSSGPWAGLNLADHVGDDMAAVRANRALLRAALSLPAEPRWLRQVHGTEVLEPGQPPGCADACFSDRPGEVCVVLTADCLPVFFCDQAGTRVALAHAGWRGLLAGVLERTVARLGVPGTEVLAWLGPAIGPAAFEVGDEVRAAFVAANPSSAACFAAHGPGHWLADLYALARQRLAACGVASVGGGDLCTFSDPDRFYSYRRDGVSGRMASLIWLHT
jgi:YfiH family protein